MLRYDAVPISPGLVIGRCRLLVRQPLPLRRTSRAPQAEQRLFEAACLRARGELEGLAALAQTADQRDILAVQRSILDDPEFTGGVQADIGQGASALEAVQRTVGRFTEALERLNDAYFTARSADIEDVGLRLADILCGRLHTPAALQEPCILIAQELYPSDLVGVQRELVAGIVLAAGSAQGHAAIIARSLGIPAAVGAGGDFLAQAADAEAALDGGRGEIYLWPDESVRARFRHQQLQARRRVLYLETLRTSPCVTQDGVRVRLLANCSNADDIRRALAEGAEGVGLLRSEFLFWGERLPDEEQQLAMYRQCLAACGGAPLTVRTLDVGADKPLPGLPPQEGANPALGLRGIRLGLAFERLLRTQLRALLRAAADGPLDILLPMVCSVQELQRVRAMLAQAAVQLQQQGVPVGHCGLGVMIETPAAALCSAQLAAHADFFSIGTNDLTQYTLAADRTDPALQAYYRPQDPAVEQLIARTLQAAAARGIPCAICGESAADPALAARYVRMGARCLSMAAPSIPPVKDALLALRALEEADDAAQDT